VSRQSEQFSAIPVRIDAAIDRGELTWRRGELLKRLVYRCRGAGATTFTLVELHEWARGYEGLTTETLRLDLVALERDGWLELDRSRGHGKNIWHAKLLGAALEYKTKDATASARRASEIAGERAPTIPSDRASRGDTDTDTEPDADVDHLNRPGGERSSVLGLEARAAASELVEAIRREHHDAGTRGVVMAYAKELPASDFHDVKRSLIDARDSDNPPRNEGKWVNGALGKRARARAAERRAA
jgi:hypothetical protein